MIPIGAAFLSGEYDFKPEELKEKRRFRRAVSWANLAVLTAILALIILNLIYLADLTRSQTQVDTAARTYKQKIGKLAQTSGSLDTYKYNFNYLQSIINSQDNPANLLLDASELLAFEGIQDMKIFYDNDRKVLEIKGTQKLERLSDVESMRTYYEEIIEKFKSGGYMVQDMSSFNLNSLTVQLNLKLTETAKRSGG